MYKENQRVRIRPGNKQCPAKLSPAFITIPKIPLFPIVTLSTPSFLFDKFK